MIEDDIKLAREYGASVSVVRRIELTDPHAIRDLLLRLAKVVEDYSDKVDELMMDHARIHDHWPVEEEGSTDVTICDVDHSGDDDVECHMVRYARVK